MVVSPSSIKLHGLRMRSFRLDAEDMRRLRQLARWLDSPCASSDEPRGRGKPRGGASGALRHAIQVAHRAAGLSS